jgi:poly(A) polymerase
MNELAQAPWLKSSSIQRVFEAIEQDGDQARAVGGAIRNTLLGEPVSDIDIATTARPDRVVERAEFAGLKAIPTGIDHGTITVISKGTPYEVTTLREDVETFGRQAKVAFGSSWIEDARRRDFTMNAIYADRHGEIHDPLDGLKDCLARRVRFIGNATERIREDYLRILRFFRIHAAYGRGTPDEVGLSACIQEREGLRHLSAERIGMEMKKLVAAPAAADAIALMEGSGLLEITTGGVSRIADYRALRSLDEIADETRSPELAFAVLSGFVDEDVDRLADRFRLSNAERKLMHGALAAATEIDREPAPLAVRKLLYRFGRKAVIDGILWVWAQARARNDREADERPFQAALSEGRKAEIPVFPLKGADLIGAGLKPGPQLGETLSELEQAWIDTGFALDTKALLEHCK